MATVTAPLRRPSTVRTERVRRGLPIVIGVAAIGALWLVAGSQGWANGMVVTPAEAIGPITGSSSNVYVRATTATVWAAARGLLIGGGLAFLLALAGAAVPGLRRSVARLAAIANAAPWVAIAPCLLIVLGRDAGPVAVSAIAVFFYVFVSTSVGLGAAPAAAHDVATALGAGRLRRVWSVQLPAAWPSVADGLKLAAPAALAGAVFGEWYGAKRGLGVLLITAMQAGRADRLWAASLLSAACGVIAFAVLSGLRAVAVDRYGAAVTQAVDRSPRPRGIRHLLIEAATVVGLVAVLVAAWWAWIELRDISAIVVPPPSRVFDDILTQPGDYASAAGSTLATAAIALLIGSVVGLVAALVSARFRLLAGMTVPVVVILAATPLVALFPLLARVIGYNPTTVWVLAAVLVFYPVFVFTRSGLTSASPAALDVVDSLGGTRGVRYLRVVLPSAVPHIASGLRIAAGSAVIAAVVGESLIGRTGLGVEFAYSYNTLELPRAFGAAVVIVVISVVVFALAGRFERLVHGRWA